MDDKTRVMMKQMAEEAAHKATYRAFTTFGLDHTNPIEVQQDMAALRELRKFLGDKEVQADLEHLRELRMTMNSVKRKGALVLMGLVVTGLISLLLMGVKTWFGAVLPKP